MKIVYVESNKKVKKTKEELQKELNASPNKMSQYLVNEYKFVPRKEPIYIVEMSMEEIKLVSFYLELEKRKPIMNVEIDAKIKENDNESTKN